MKKSFLIKLIKHCLMCFTISIISPLFAAGLALGWEWGDKKTITRHWCGPDLIAAAIGIALGSMLNTELIGLLS